MLGSDRPRRAHLPPILAVAFVVAASGLGPAHQTQSLTADPPPSEFDPRVFDIVGAVSAERIEADIRTLVGFGTRHTLSETESETRGIGAARRWINAEFDRISDACGGCLEVSFQRHRVAGDPDTRIRVDTEVVNVLAVLRGSTDPNRYLIMSGDIDSRISDIFNSTDDSPGANDNASGMAGTIEAARVLSRHRFNATIVLVGLSGEEQGLIGGRRMAEAAKAAGWNIEGVLNNDMIGNIEGIDGVVENNTFRVFSEPIPVTETETQRLARRRLGGEVDGVSRQLARYVARIADRYIPNLDAVMVYRLDRFGRGGHHRPFNDLGFPGVRIMETHENYARQHQDVRVEDGIQYGDLLTGVNAEYAAKLNRRQRRHAGVPGMGSGTPGERGDRGCRPPVDNALLGCGGSGRSGRLQSLLARDDGTAMGALAVRRQRDGVHPREHHHRQLSVRSRRGRHPRQRERRVVSAAAGAPTVAQL